MTPTPEQIAATRKPVPDYEGLYEIDHFGNVYSLPRKVRRINRGRRQTLTVKGCKLARSYSRKGYPQTCLHKEGASKTIEIHRLVCIAFHGAPVSTNLVVAHLDGDKINSTASNLAWVTPKENSGHKRIHGTLLTGSDVPNSKLKLNQVLEIIRNVSGGQSRRSVAKDFGVSEKLVRLILNGERWADHTAHVRKILENENGI